MLGNGGDRRAVAIDLFRIVLCLGVFVYHLTPVRCSSGPLSVNGFLVMSGFLVGVSVFGGREFNTNLFYSKKCKRLLPMCVMAFLIAVVGRLVEGGGFPEWTSQKWGHFSAVEFVMHYNVPMWYMVIEILLLLVVPFFVFLSRVKYLLELYLSAMIVVVYFLFTRVPDNAMFGDGLYYSPFVRSWQFIAGMLAGRYAIKWQIQKFSTNCVYKLSFGILFLVFIVSEFALMVLKQSSDLHGWNYSFSFDALTTIFYVLLIPGLYFTHIKISPRLSYLLAKGAELTYPVYLIHVVARGACELIVDKTVGNVSYAIVACVTFGVSIVSAWCLLWADKRVQLMFKRK